MADVLEWGGVLPPPHTARAVDVAVLAAGIAVAAAVGHALGPGVGVVVHVRGRGGGHGRGHGEVGGGGHAVVVDGGAGGPAEVVAVVGVAADSVGDDGDRVRAGAFTSKRLDLGQGRVRGQAGRLLGQHGRLALAAQGLLLGEGLLLPAHLATAAAGFGAALSPEEAEAGPARPCCWLVAVGLRNRRAAGRVGRAVLVGGGLGGIGVLAGRGAGHDGRVLALTGAGRVFARAILADEKGGQPGSVRSATPTAQQIRRAGDATGVKLKGVAPWGWQGLAPSDCSEWPGSD